MKQWNRGKAVIVGIFLLALVLSGYAWWHQYRQGTRCRTFLGAEAVQLIRLAPQVELLRLSVLGADAGEAKTLNIAGSSVAITDETDITAVPGLLHARHALLQDLNYRWDAPRTDCDPRWAFALRFVQAERQAVIAFDPHCGLIARSGGPGTELLLGDLMQTFTTKTDEWESRAETSR